MTTTHFRPRRSQVRASGFTVTELLVVIGIIVLLIGVVGFVVGKSRRAATAARVKADFQAIAMGLEAFKQDHREYPGIPRIPAVPGQNPGGADDSFLIWKHNALALCLLSPGPAGTFGVGQPFRDTRSGFYFDGAPPAPVGGTGQGFVAVPGGKVWQAYLSTDRFKVVRGAGRDGSLNTNDDTVDVLDAFGGPVQYYPMRNAKASQIAAPPSTSGLDPTPFPFQFDARDGLLDAAELAMALGESDVAPSDINNTYDGGESPTVSAGYLLVSLGEDMKPLDLNGAGPGEKRKLFDARDRNITLSNGDGRSNDNVYSNE